MNTLQIKCLNNDPNTVFILQRQTAVNILNARLMVDTCNRNGCKANLHSWTALESVHNWREIDMHFSGLSPATLWELAKMSCLFYIGHKPNWKWVALGREENSTHLALFQQGYSWTLWTEVPCNSRKTDAWRNSRDFFQSKLVLMAITSFVVFFLNCIWVFLFFWKN